MRQYTQNNTMVTRDLDGSFWVIDLKTDKPVSREFDNHAEALEAWESLPKGDAAPDNLIGNRKQFTRARDSIVLDRHLDNLLATFGKDAVKRAVRRKKITSRDKTTKKAG